MPATEDVWRSSRVMHVIFAASCLLLLAATFWMVTADFNDEWRGVQRLGYQLSAQQVRDEERAIKSKSFVAESEKLKKDVQVAKDKLAANQTEISRLKALIARDDGDLTRQLTVVRSSRANRDKVRADMGLMVRDNRTAALENQQRRFDEAQAKVNEAEVALQELQAKANKNKEALAAITKERDDAEAALKKHNADIVRLEKVRDQIDPSGVALAKWNLMELPIIEGFNGHLKIQQLWLPTLKQGYGGMTQVARFDRCITCHTNIDKVKPGNLAAFPYDPEGAGLENGWAMLAADHAAEQRAKAAGETYVPPERTYDHPYATHPRPDVYLTAASPHPMQKFGCTGCHDGQGSGTSFHNVQHTPNNPAIGEEWSEKYGWFYNHFWEYPMFPKRMTESGCIKCHHSVVELGENPTFGATAPTAYEGFDTIRKYGCFGCHEINGYNAGKPIGPDMRLEPQTEEEAARIAADPTAVPGEYRKVGPGLKHFASKSSRDWAEYWITNPQNFHPDTRMPRFFGLTNQNDALAQKFQPVEIAALAEFLLTKSADIKLDNWGDYNPDPVRGKKLFSERGCLACHKHDDFPGTEADFGPNLTDAHAKIKRDKSPTKTTAGENNLSQWLYTWVREPTRHSPRTKMPDLFLDPYEEGGVTIDPAADIAAYLLEKPVGDFSKQAIAQGTQFDAALDELVREFLKKTLSAAEVENTMVSGKYPTPIDQIKGDEIELAGKPITREMKLAYVGRRTISRYGCYGCHDIAEFEKARPIGTALQDWGRKDPTKLALEHIEEYLHHHGEPDGSSTQKRVEEATLIAANGAFATKEEAESETAAAYFYNQLTSHGRAGFLWQKLRDPRSYDYETLTTKGYDERLRMPKFPFSEREIQSVATFVLGLVAEPPAEEYVYRPQGAAKARIDGEKLLKKYNCTACHMVDMPEIRYRETPDDYVPDASTPASFAIERKKLGSDHVVGWIRGASPSQLAVSDVKELGRLVKTLAEAPEDAKTQQIDPRRVVELYDRLKASEGAKDQAAFHQQFDALVKALKFGEWSKYSITVTQDPESKDWSWSQIVEDIKSRKLLATAPAITNADLIAAAEAKDVNAALAGLLRTIDAAGSAAQHYRVTPESLDNLAQALKSEEVGYEQFNTLLARLAFADWDPLFHLHGADMLLKLKKPRAEQIHGYKGKPFIEVGFKGLLSQGPDLEADPDQQEYGYDLWQTLELDQRLKLPAEKMLFPAKNFVSASSGRGGDFAVWLVDHLMASDKEIKRTGAWQMSPPPLYEEGAKVQTPWLYHFLLNPTRLRFTTRLRMPKFNMSEDEAQALANYFAAADGSEFPYQRIPQREPAYLNSKQAELAQNSEGKGQDYRRASWDMLNVQLCNGCHAVAGKPYMGKDPVKEIRGPNLDVVAERLRPDWTLLWLYKPSWITPYTSMPQPFGRPPEGQAPAFPTTLGNDGDGQTIGVRDALMNYHGLMEAYGKVPTVGAPAAPAEEPAAAPPAGEKK